MKKDLLSALCEGEKLTLQEQIRLILQLAFPAIMAQVSVNLMHFIDAAMVGSLGANATGAIALMSSSTWLFNSTTNAVALGFTVQIAHKIGAGKDAEARNLVRQGYVVALGISAILLTLGIVWGIFMPGVLGGAPDIIHDASVYFLIYACTIPFAQINNLSTGMLQCSGNMKMPSMLRIVMCILDVIFNYFLIFPTRQVGFLGNVIRMPGAGLGVTGAALGTSLAQITITIILTFSLLFKEERLKLRKEEHLEFKLEQLKAAVRIAIPVALESWIMCGAQIMSTVIIAPLGTISLSAHSLAVTIEGFCYMPGFGISIAATTLVGQSMGAKREDMTRRLAWLTVGCGMVLMTIAGALMFIFAPFLIGLMTPVSEIQNLGAMVLRIEALVEPLYAASIVANGVFRGAGDTLIPSGLSLVTMWMIRLPIAAFLAGRLGLRGIWIAMAIELSVKGIIFLIRLSGKSWEKKAKLVQA